jgi:hypothetical protein
LQTIQKKSLEPTIKVYLKNIQRCENRVITWFPTLFLEL